MRKASRLDPRSQRFWILGVELAGNHVDALLELFLRRFAEDPRTCGLFDELTTEAIEARQRDYQEDLLCALARKVRIWLLENNSTAVDPELPTDEEWKALIRTAVDEYFEFFAARLQNST